MNSQVSKIFLGVSKPVIYSLKDWSEFAKSPGQHSLKCLLVGLYDRKDSVNFTNEHLHSIIDCFIGCTTEEKYEIIEDLNLLQ